MIQLFAILKDRIEPMPVAEGVTGFHDLYAGLPLGVYSSLRTFEQNKFLGLDAHIARTHQSVALLKWDVGLDEPRLREGLHEILSSHPSQQAKVRYDLLAEPIEVAGEQTRLLVGVFPFEGIPDGLYEHGVSVGFAEALHRENPLAKTAVFVNERTQYPIGTPDAYERLLVNGVGEILECTSANFYAVINGTLYTANDGILEGITRKIILQLVAELNIPLQLTPPRLDQIDAFEEAGLSSSSRALIPIVKIGEQVIGNGRSGPIMTKLLKAYQDYVGRAVETAVG
jgi:branched-chain amino acid aminotransferase